MSRPVQSISEEWLRSRVAWLHFVAGMTQHDISEKYGLSRPKVNRIVQQVRNDGLVKVELALPLSNCLDLAEKVRATYEISQVVVVPSVPDYEHLQRVIGETAGDLLTPLLHSHKGLTLGWGRTLSFAIPRLAFRNTGLEWVVGAMGCRPHGAASNTFEVISAAARVTSSDSHYLTVPILCTDINTRQSLLAHPEISTIIDMAQSAAVSLTTCGDLSEKSLMMSVSGIRNARDSLIEAGAVGEVLGTFMNGEGSPVDHPINEQVMAMPVSALREKKISMLAAGGKNKMPIIRSALLGGYVTHLVTDDEIASCLVE